LQLEEHVALAPRTTLGVGGPARYFVEVESEEQLIEALAWAEGRGVPVRVLGGGSNLLINDDGVEGLVLAIGISGVRELAQASGSDTVRLCAGAGENWDTLVLRAVRAGLSGIEGLSGVPGSVGATPIQNVGAYGQEVAETVVRVRAIDRHSRQAVEFTNGACRFSYRDSFFKSEAPERYVITEVEFALRRGTPAAPCYPELARALTEHGYDAPSSAELREVVLGLRRSKSMLLEPSDENARSCGSFFLNPIVTARVAERVRALAAPASPPAYPQPDGRIKLAAAWLIEHSGFTKGQRDGRAGISNKHALALVAHDGASAADVKRLAQRIQHGVRERFGIELVPEPVFW
jgi:UDP-N-acetylmuramate dehydrogenase